MIINKELKDYIYQIDDVMQANIMCAEFFDEHFYAWEPTTDIAYFESFANESLYRELILDLDGLNEEDIDEEFFNECLLPAFVRAACPVCAEENSDIEISVSDFITAGNGRSAILTPEQSEPPFRGI